MELNKSTLNRYKPKRNPSECRICGVDALYSYYGVISCYSCKVFFRRSAPKTLKCHFDGHCQINQKTRQTCASCRFNKCLQLGMQTELIRGPHSRSSRSGKSTRIAKLPTLTLLDKDVSSLSDNQWICLRNLTNSYDHSMICFISNEMTISTGRNPSLVRKLAASFYEAAGMCVRVNADIYQLPFEDRSILLQTAADNITCLGGIFFLHQTHLFYDEGLWENLQAIYGKTAIDYHRWSIKYTPLDVIIFKLALVLFAFSTNSRIFQWDISTEYTNPTEVLIIENQYAEVIWQYLVYKYGYGQSIKIFVQLTEWFLKMTVAMSYAHDSQTHVNDLNSMIEQTELALMLDDVDRIV